MIRALTSDRAYRPAWPPDRALRHLEADRDGHFDPRCLDAFLTLMAERGHRPAGRPDELAPAGDSCHEQLPMPVRAPGGSDPGTGT